MTSWRMNECYFVPSASHRETFPKVILKNDKSTKFLLAPNLNVIFPARVLQNIGRLIFYGLFCRRENPSVKKYFAFWLYLCVTIVCWWHLIRENPWRYLEFVGPWFPKFWTTENSFLVKYLGDLQPVWFYWRTGVWTVILRRLGGSLFE